MKIKVARNSRILLRSKESSGQSLSADQSREVHPIYTLGPIIHNEEVVCRSCRPEVYR